MFVGLVREGLEVLYLEEKVLRSSGLDSPRQCLLFGGMNPVFKVASAYLMTIDEIREQQSTFTDREAELLAREENRKKLPAQVAIGRREDEPLLKSIEDCFVDKVRVAGGGDQEHLPLSCLDSVHFQLELRGNLLGEPVF